MHILIVDDAVLTRSILRHILQTKGHEVTEAANVDEAMAKIARRQPDMVITDLMMPDRDGVEFFQQAASVTKAPFIMITASSDSERLRTAQNSGFLKVLQKPVDVEKLFAVIDAHATASSGTATQEVMLRLKPALVARASEMAKAAGQKLEEFLGSLLEKSIQ